MEHAWFVHLAGHVAQKKMAMQMRMRTKRTKRTKSKVKERSGGLFLQLSHMELVQYLAEELGGDGCKKWLQCSDSWARCDTCFGCDWVLDGVCDHTYDFGCD